MKHVFLLFAFAFITLEANSQSFRIGVKGGANYADISGKDLDKNAHNYKLSWHAGAMLNIQYPGNTWFSIQPELIYSRKGYESSSLPFTISDNQGNPIYEAERSGYVNLNYLDLPVLFNFKSGIIVFEFGPQFSYLVGYRNDAVFIQTLGDGTIITSEDGDRRFSENRLNKFDVGLATGFRLETQNGVGLGLRFNQGFIKLDNGEPRLLNAPRAPIGSNQVFQLFVSYLLPR